MVGDLHASFDALINQLSRDIVPGSNTTRFLIFSAVIVLAATIVIITTKGQLGRAKSQLASRYCDVRRQGGVVRQVGGGCAVQVSPGSMLASRYRLVRLLGRGGMAEVYEANDGVLGRRVAVKVFRDETDIATSQARQQLEIQALARLQHPNIVAVFDAGTDAGVSFVVMQLIEGVTLAERTEGSALAPADTARIGRPVADALAHVHSLGMVHRDIKPGNILCGANGTIFLSDFGIVRLIGRTRLTQHGTIGTISYLAPEQVRGEDVGTAADIYALGLVLLECLTGAPEYPGSSAESAVARLSRPPHVPAAVPQSWADLLTCMTVEDPAARPSAREVARILHDLSATSAARTVLADESPSRVRTKPMTIAPRMPSPEPAPVRSRQRRGAAWLAAAGALAAVLMVAVLVWLLPRGSNFGPGQPVPTESAGPDRLRQDLQDLQSVVQP